jgi:hypothetical protein
MGTTVVSRPDRPSILQAHSEVLAHVDARRADAAANLAELSQGMEHTQRGTFGSRALEAAVVRERRRLVFLDKVGLALRSGYTLMPNIGLTLLAVRTTRGVSGTLYEHCYGGRPSELNVPAQALPPGEGAFVSPEPELKSWPETRGEGNDKHSVTVYQATEHAPVDVPITLVRQELAEALEHALDERLFDEIGIAQDSAKKDPLLIGRILHPKARSFDRRGVAFFLGWWFDPRALD